MNGFLSPAEIGDVWVGNGVKKASLSIGKMLLLGIFAGRPDDGNIMRCGAVYGQ